MKEHVLSLNDFKMPKVFNDTDTKYILIIRLLLLEPGKFQSHPEMGIGLKSRYRYNNDENFLINLQHDINTQINKYLPELSVVDITVNVKNQVLGIIINTTNGAYVVAYDADKDLTEAAATYVLDDLWQIKEDI